VIDSPSQFHDGTVDQQLLQELGFSSILNRVTTTVHVDTIDEAKNIPNIFIGPDSSSEEH
jgi:hypothetical protein